MAGNEQPVRIRVLAASSGVCYNISLFSNELTVNNIRRQLAGAVPPQDQILLLGPPYKVPKDATLRSHEILSSLRLGDEEDARDFSQGTPLSTTERTGAKRLFLFSKQALSEAAPEPLPCHLEPMQLQLPSQPDPSPVVFQSQPQTQQQHQHQQQQQHSNMNQAREPLHQALEVYERRFMLHLCRGRALADGADLRMAACRTCVEEQAVMARALRAAVSNLSDHRNAAARTRTEFASTFALDTTRHATLLATFENTLAKLQTQPLHPTLVQVARASGRIMETLLDTVPVERERAWAHQCNTSHQRLVQLCDELEADFAKLGTPASRDAEARKDKEAEEEVANLSHELEGTGTAKQMRDSQAQRLDRLTKDHGDVVKVVMNAIASDDDETSGSKVQAAFTTLEKMSKASSDVLPSMEADDLVLMDLMKRVADAKTMAMKRIRQRLRQISIAQSSIQRVLSSVAVLRDALAQQCDNMLHLEHVAELPTCYNHFLSEVRRRRAYGGAVTSCAAAMIERLASMRADEVKSREKFLRASGRHLMPPFFEIFAPTLATPPPLFTPQLPAMVEMESLPDVGPALGATASVGGGAAAGGSSSFLSPNDSPMQGNASGEAHGVSSASSLTDSQPQQQQSKTTISSSVEQECVVSEDVGNRRAEDADALIVSAEETTSARHDDDEHDHDVIMEPHGDHGAHAAAAEAERKTLAYENAVLRQAVERMGGKTPRTYIDEARAATQEESFKEVATSPQSQNNNAKEEALQLQSKVDKLRSELEQARSLVQTANEALVKAKMGSEDEPNDKISHSNFEVGDVGLFMPTGRGTGGKRTYVAFHSSCPHRYLSTDSIDGTHDFVLGRIVYQEDLVAGARGTDSNPYGLNVGTKFWVLTVEVIRVP